MSDDNKLLDVKGYKLRPGLVRNSAGDYVSPLTSAETVYDGDKNLSDILEDIEKEKKSFPEVVIKNVHINPDQWIPYGDYFCFNYADPLLPVDRVSEVRCNDKNMKKIVDDMIRWIISEDTAPNSIAIYAQKRPTKELDLKLVIYTKYLKIPLDINKTDWKNSKSMKRYKVEDERINYDKLGLFHLDKDNISLFLNNNFSVVITNEKYAYIYTDKAIKINATLVLIDKHIEYTNDIFEEDGIYNVNWYVDGIIIKKEKVKEGEDATPPANVELDDYQTFLDVKPMYNIEGGGIYSAYNIIYTLNNNNRLCRWDTGTLNDRLSMIDISTYIGLVKKIEFCSAGILCLTISNVAYYIGNCVTSDDFIEINNLKISKMMEDADDIDCKVIYKNKSAYIIVEDGCELDKRMMGEDNFTALSNSLYKFNAPYDVERLFIERRLNSIIYMMIISGNKLYILGGGYEFNSLLYLCGVSCKENYTTTPIKIEIPFDASLIKDIYAYYSGTSSYSYILLNNGDCYGCGILQKDNIKGPHLSKYTKLNISNVKDITIVGSSPSTLMVSDTNVQCYDKGYNFINDLKLNKLYSDNNEKYMVGLTNNGEIFIYGTFNPISRYNSDKKFKKLNIPIIYKNWIPDYHNVQKDLDIGLSGNTFSKSLLLQSLFNDVYLVPSTTRYRFIFSTDDTIFVMNDNMKTIQYSLKDGTISEDPIEFQIPIELYNKIKSNDSYLLQKVHRIDKNNYITLYLDKNEYTLYVLEYKDDDINTNTILLPEDILKTNLIYDVSYISNDEIYIVAGTYNDNKIYKCDSNGNSEIIVSGETKKYVDIVNGEFMYTVQTNDSITVYDKNNNQLYSYALLEQTTVFRGLLFNKNTYLVTTTSNAVQFHDITNNIMKSLDVGINKFSGKLSKYNNTQLFLTPTEIHVITTFGTIVLNVNTGNISCNDNHIPSFCKVLNVYTNTEKIAVKSLNEVITLKNLSYSNNTLIDDIHIDDIYYNETEVFNLSKHYSTVISPSTQRFYDSMFSIGDAKIIGDYLYIISSYNYSYNDDQISFIILERIKNGGYDNNVEQIKKIDVDKKSISNTSYVLWNYIFEKDNSVGIVGAVNWYKDILKINTTCITDENSKYDTTYRYHNIIQSENDIYEVKSVNGGSSIFKETPPLSYDTTMNITKVNTSSMTESTVYSKQVSSSTSKFSLAYANCDHYKLLNKGTIFAEFNESDKVIFHYGSSYSTTMSLEDIIGETKFKELSMYSSIGCVEYNNELIVVLTNGFSFDEHMCIYIFRIDKDTMKLNKTLKSYQMTNSYNQNDYNTSYHEYERNIGIDQNVLVFMHYNLLIVYDLDSEEIKCSYFIKNTKKCKLKDVKKQTDNPITTGVDIIVQDLTTTEGVLYKINTFFN